MANINPLKIPGRWREGFALDYHTIASTYVGDDEHGHPQFHTVRSELGELLYGLKYKSDQASIEPLANAAADFLKTWQPGVELLMAVPATRQRAVQPVSLILQAVSALLGIPASVGAVRRVKDLPELKNVYDFHNRTQLLKNAYSIEQATVGGRKVLLMDDLFRSGAP